MHRTLLFALMVPLFASSAFGWGCEGHQVIALIARAHLTPAVSAAVDELLRASPVDPALTRFCQDRPADPMADAATWADDVKNQAKTSLWHYVDIPLSVESVTGLDPWCPPIGPSVEGRNRPGCITDAIEYELAILRDQSRPEADRATALRYIIHLVGDIHQPLHTEDNNDQGGNCTAMQFFAEARPANLHAIWDYKLIEHQLAQTKLTQPAYAAALNSRFPGKFAAVATAKADDPVAWAWESHRLAESTAYGLLEPGIPVETPDPKAVCGAERDKVQALHIAIAEAYSEKAMPVIDEQLAIAGFRLAVLLNATI